MVVYFLSSDTAPQLDKLRKRLERNTRNLVALFRERADIAKEIGQVKEENSIPIRIREREKEILDSLPELDVLSKSIISSLFEFTIANEHVHAGKMVNPILGSLSLSGEPRELLLLAGLLISAPGVEVYNERPLPGPLELGIQANGGHVVHEELPEPDMVVGLDIDEPCGIMVCSAGTININMACLRSPRALRILVKQA